MGASAAYGPLIDARPKVPARSEPSTPSTAPAPRGAIALAVCGLLLMALIGAAAPNDHTIDTRLPLSALPPLPGPVSTLLICAAVAAQGIALLGLLRAAARGWSPSPRRLLGVGALGAALLCAGTPVGSADLASYAAYGRIADLGGDPYHTAPADLGGPYGQLVSEIWQHTPSVYGPIATWIQQAAAAVGGTRPWLSIWLLVLANAGVYLLAGWLLVRIAPDRVRAALLWAANPLLLGQLVAGGHLDTYVALFGAAAAFAALRARRLRHELLVGLLLGLACGVKISSALIALGLTWPLLRSRSWRRVLVRTLVCLLVLAALYLPFGPGALTPLAGASRLISTPSFWELLDWTARAGLGASASTSAALMGLLWPPLMLATAALFYRLYRRTEPAAPTPVLATYTLGGSWLLAAPWIMPWYSALVWPFAALLRHNRSDRWLVLLTTGLALFHNTGGHGWSW